MKQLKSLLNKYPTASRFILAILFFGLALMLSSSINKGVIKDYFPYTAVILLGVATWFMYKTENKSLSEIGVSFRLGTLKFLPLGVLIGAFALLVAKGVRALYTGESFAVSDAINYESICFAFYFILPTVAVEEFLFRGYLFKKTISKTNVVIANIIFSMLFMSIHVIDENVLQNKGMIVFLVISIPVGHLWFATAMLKSKSLFFPIGLHLGNNWATRHLVTSSNSGDSFLYTLNNSTFNTWPSFIGFLLVYNGVFLVVTFLIWKWDQIKNIKFLRK